MMSMKKSVSKILTVCLCAAAAALMFAGCDGIAVPNTNTGTDDGGSTDTGDFDDFAPAMYVGNYTYGFWDQINSGLEPDFAIGDFERTVSMEQTSEGTMKVTVAPESSIGWSAGTCAQLANSAKTISYYNFSTVAAIKFKVRGTVSLSNFKFKIEAKDKTTPIAETPISQLDPSVSSTYSSTAWTQVTINASSVGSKEIKLAFCYVLGTTVGSWVEFKDIDWVDASGNSVDITQNVAY